MAKAVSGFVGLSTAIMMMGPAVASAATVEELTAQINALLAQVSALQASSSSSSSSSVTTSGHVFSVDLTIGSKGDDVVALQTILVAKGHLVMPEGVAMGYFGGLTKAAVAAWQAASGIAPAVGYFGPKSRAAMNAMAPTTTSTTTTTTSTSLPTGCTSNVGFSPITGVSCVTGTTAVVGTGVNAMLDASSPATKSIIAGTSVQGVTTIAAFKLTNGGSAAAKVTMLKFKRTGLSSDSTVNNVYLYDSMGNRLTDAASVSTGVISFSDAAAGLITIPAGGSVVVLVRADFATGQNGQSIGIMLTEATADAGTVGGLPISAAEHNLVASPTGMTTFSFSNATTPTGGTVDPQNDYVLWQNTASVGSRDALLSAIRFQQIGSVYAADIKNFRLMIDGVQVGTAVEMADANRFVSFNFATPITVKAGGHVVKLVGDIVGGSNRNFQFSVRRVVDAEVWDSQLNVSVAPLVNSGAFVAVDGGGTVAITVGSLTISKDTTSASGNVVKNGSSVSLAKFKFRAQGESMKVENLRVNFTDSLGGVTAATDVGLLRNAGLFLDGVQVGSTASLCEDSVTTGCTAASYTQFNLGSSMVLLPGKDYIVEVRADVFDADGTDNTAAGETITVNIIAGSSNVYRTSSLSYTTNGLVSGNQVTVASGSLVVAKYSAYADQTVTVPQGAQKIGEYRVTTGNTEGVNVDTFTLDFTGSGSDANVSKLQNVYIVYGTQTSATKSSVSTTSNTFSVNTPLVANGSMAVSVYATLPTTMVNLSTIQAKMTVSGTSQSSGLAVTSSPTLVVAQIVTVGTGTLTAALDTANTPVSANVVGNSMPKLASFKFTAQNDSFTITSLTATTTAPEAFIELVFKDGATEIGRQPFNGSVATKTGISVPVGSNLSKTIDVYGNLGSIGTGFASTSATATISLVAYEKQDSNGVKTPIYLNTTALTGNAAYVFKTKPTITNVALPTTVLAAGTPTISKFMITADAGGTISWKKILMNFSTSTSAVSLASFNIYDASNESTALTGASIAVDYNLGTLTITSTIDQEVSGSKTYVIKATAGGTISTGATVSTNIPTGAVAHTDNQFNGVVVAGSSFTWSDESALGHTVTTNDWFDDFLVKNIPTDSQTLTK